MFVYSDCDYCAIISSTNSGINYILFTISFWSKGMADENLIFIHNIHVETDKKFRVKFFCLKFRF